MFTAKATEAFRTAVHTAFNARSLTFLIANVLAAFIATIGTASGTTLITTFSAAVVSAVFAAIFTAIIMKSITASAFFGLPYNYKQDKDEYDTE
jgi:hypothetical protein